MIIGFVPATNTLGSSRAAARMSASSKVHHSASTASPDNFTRVLLPLCRAPFTRTTRVSAIASSTSARPQICRRSACKSASR